MQGWGTDFKSSDSVIIRRGEDTETQKEGHVKEAQIGVMQSQAKECQMLPVAIGGQERGGMLQISPQSLQRGPILPTP